MAQPKSGFQLMKMYKKRERTQNWTPEEKRYLLELCEKRLDILENKRIDSASSSLKGLTWKYIHEKFGARFGLERDVQRLREQWRRMKGHAKNEMYNFTQYEKRFGPNVANAEQRASTLSEAIWRSLGVSKENGNQNNEETSNNSDDGETSNTGDRILDGLLLTALQGAGSSGNQHCNLADVNRHTNERSTNSSPSLSDEDGLVIDIKEEIIEPIIDIEEDLGPYDGHKNNKDSYSKSLNGNEITPVMNDAQSNIEINCSNVFANQNYQISTSQKKSVDAFALEIFKMKAREQKRRMEMMEAEHAIRMETLELKRDTKRMKREMTLAEKNNVSSVRFGSDQLGSMGSGAGKGGGGGGSIREAGGAFGKMEAAREEEYFYKQQKEQLQKLKADLTDEISFHEEQVKRHQEAIQRHSQRVHDIESKSKH